MVRIHTPAVLEDNQFLICWFVYAKILKPKFSPALTNSEAYIFEGCLAWGFALAEEGVSELCVRSLRGAVAGQ